MLCNVTLTEKGTKFFMLHALQVLSVKSVLSDCLGHYRNAMSDHAEWNEGFHYWARKLMIATLVHINVKIYLTQ